MNAVLINAAILTASLVAFLVFAERENSLNLFLLLLLCPALLLAAFRVLSKTAKFALTWCNVLFFFYAFLRCRFGLNPVLPLLAFSSCVLPVVYLAWRSLRYPGAISYDTLLVGAVGLSTVMYVLPLMYYYTAGENFELARFIWWFVPLSFAQFILFVVMPLWTCRFLQWCRHLAGRVVANRLFR